MTAGDILDQAIRIYRHNFVSLVTIVAIVSVPVVLIQVAFSAPLFSFTNDFSDSVLINSPELSGLLWIGSFIAAIVAAVLTVFQNAALAWFVSERFLGRATTVRQSYGKAFRRWLALLIAAVFLVIAVGGLFVIIFGVAFVPLIGLGAFAASDAAAALAGLVFLCMCALFIPALVVSLFLYTRWTFWTQAIVIENYNSTGGLGRSWKLTRGTFWRVLGFNFILFVIISFFSAGPIYLISFTAFFLPSVALAFVINTLASSLIVMVITPLQYAVLTVLYYDVRIRKEGFDLQFQMENTGAGSLPPLYSGSSQ